MEEKLNKLALPSVDKSSELCVRGENGRLHQPAGYLINPGTYKADRKNTQKSALHRVSHGLRYLQ